MASNTLSGDLISERYGAALYDLASEKKCIDDILNDFQLVQKALKESSELRQVIKSPLVNSDEKLIILLKLFSKANLHNLTTTFLKVLDNNKRISNIASINVDQRYMFSLAVKLVFSYLHFQRFV